MIRTLTVAIFKVTGLFRQRMLALNIQLTTLMTLPCVSQSIEKL